jgi:hypothetical protein
VTVPVEAHTEGLLERGKQLAARISDFQTQRNMVTEAKRYHTRADQLEGPAATLSGWLPVWHAFRQHGLAVDIDQQAVAALRRLASRVAEDFERNPESLLEANPMLRRSFWDPLATLERDLETALVAAWCAHIDSQMPPRQDELLDVLVALPDFRVQVGSIRALYRDLDALKRTLSPGADLPNLLGRPTGLATNITRAMSQLQGSGVPAEVLEFIKLASTPAGAAYESFSDPVRDWFAARGLLRSLRLRLGSAT